MPHENAAATHRSHSLPAAKPHHELIVLDDGDLLALFQSERDINRARCLVPAAASTTNLQAEPVKRVLAADAQIEELLTRLLALEDSCQRIAKSVDHLEMFVETVDKRLRTVAIETGAGRWPARLRNGSAVLGLWVQSAAIRHKAFAVDFVGNHGMRDASGVTTRMAVRIALLLTIFLAGAVLLARLEGAGARSAVSVHPAVRNARLADIVLAADQSAISRPVLPPSLTDVVARETPAATSTRSRQRAARFVGTLIVESKPAGAVVMVDQRKVGITPARLSDVPVGSHALWVVGNEHQRWTTAVTVRASGVTRVFAYLDRKD